MFNIENQGHSFHCIYCLKRQNEVIGYMYASIISNELENAGEKFRQNAVQLCRQFDCDISLNILDGNVITKVRPSTSFNGQYLFEHNTSMALEYKNKEMFNSLIKLINKLFKK